MSAIFSRKALTKIQAAVIVVIVVVVLLGGAYYYSTIPGAPAPTTAVPTTAVYAYVTTNVVVFWDPSETYSNEVVVMNNVYEQLVRYDPFKDEYMPVLATRWDVSADGLTYTFDLRQGVKFRC